MDSQLEKVKKELQCVIHLEIRRGPIYSCGENCHLLCQNCLHEIQSRDNKCPMCRVDLPEHPSRNYAIERTIAQLELPLECKNNTIGCLYKGSEDEVAEHLLECQFTPVFCPDIRCQRVFGLCNVLKHIEENDDHGSYGNGDTWVPCDGDVITRSIYSGYKQASVIYDLRMAEWQEYTLFPMLYKKGNMYHVWMYILGDEETAKKCPPIKILMESPRSSVMLLTHVIPISVGLKDVMKCKDKVLTLTNYQAWQCVTVTSMRGGKGKEGRKLCIKYEIMDDNKSLLPGELRLHSQWEKDRLKKIVKQAVEKEHQIGDKWYFIDSMWLLRLACYLGLDLVFGGLDDGRTKVEDYDSDKQDHPGPISPEKLFFYPHNFHVEGISLYYHLRKGLEEWTDYYWIAEEGWNALVEEFSFRDGEYVMTKMERSVFKGEDGKPTLDIYTLNLCHRLGEPLWNLNMDQEERDFVFQNLTQISFPLSEKIANVVGALKKEYAVSERATKSVSLEPFEHWSGHTDISEYCSESLEWADFRDGDCITLEVEGNDEQEDVEANERTQEE